MSTVNIIMSTYNGARYVAQQIDSILNSDYTDWSLFITDDVSKDDTIDIIRQYVALYPERITLYKNITNKGAGRNFLETLYSFNRREHAIEGLPKSSNEAQYYMFCDQDDVWEKTKIEDTLYRMKLMEKKYGKDKPALVFTDAMVVNSRLKVTDSSFYKSNRLKVNNTGFAGLLMENKCIGCTMMINQALLDRYTVVPEHARMHDYWIALIASAFGHISYLPAKTLKYRQHEDNVIGGCNYTSYISNRISNFKAQKNSLKENWLQAEEFEKIYGDSLDEKKRILLSRFIDMQDKSWYKRRVCMVKNGFLKSGLIRNLGLFLIA